MEIYEVKSSTSVKDIYLDDAAYQCYVLTKLGYTVKRVCIVHINNQYVRKGELLIPETTPAERWLNSFARISPKAYAQPHTIWDLRKDV